MDFPPSQVPTPPANPSPGKQSGVFFRSVFFVGIFGTLVALLLGGAIFLHFSSELPKIITVEDYRPPGVTRVLAQGRDDGEMGEFFKERRYLIPFEKIPSIVIEAFVSAEDDRFFEHSGINILSIIRAGIANFRAGHVVQGGSTITQQVAKSLLLSPERSFDRKIKELFLANRIEKNLTKQQILYLYLNQIYLGHGAYGIQAAARAYFRKDISEVTLAESALLAGMPQAPGKYSPFLNAKRAKERQVYVLRRMVENKYITSKQYEDATRQAIRVFSEEDPAKKSSAYYVEHVRRYLIEKYGEKKVYEEGLTVSVPTTIPLSRLATKSLREGLMTVDKRIGYRGPLKHLNSAKDVDQFLVDTHKKLIEQKVQYHLFLPSGQMDLEASAREANIHADEDLIDEGELYEAVVTELNSATRSATVKLGRAQATLPLQHMKWARRARDESNALAYRPEPSQPSQVFRVGDVILVSKVAHAESSPGLTVALEQEPHIQGALFSLEVETGNVVAMVGGYDFAKSEFNRATQANRQLGSVFKPVIYSAALEKGFTPASIIVDSPIVFKDAEGLGKWKPNNFEKKFYGDTTFRQALIKSRNIPTIKLVQSVQVPYLIQYSKRLGINTPMNADLSISLGSASMSLMDLVKVYSLFPRLGQKVTPVFITQVKTRDGQILESHDEAPWNPTLATIAQQSSPPENADSSSHLEKQTFLFPSYPPPDNPNQLLDPRVAFVMTHLMKEAVAFGTGHEAQNVGRIAAGKTGTTNDYNDAWFVGFTPHLLTGIWVGFDNSKSIGPAETGARAALPIWLSYMKQAVRPYPAGDFAVPSGVIFANIDPVSGKLARPGSASAIREAFVAGTEPGETSDESRTSVETQSDFFKEDTE